MQALEFIRRAASLREAFSVCNHVRVSLHPVQSFLQEAAGAGVIGCGDAVVHPGAFAA